MRIKGKHALVTGSSRGIGRGIAIKLAEHGVNVAINYATNQTAAQETLSEIRKLDSDGLVVQADVTNPAEIDAMFDQVEAEWGSLDIFVNNALGDLFSFYERPLKLTVEQFERAASSQSCAFLLCCQRAARLMKNGGRIVAMSVVDEGHRTGGWQPYAAVGSAKAALEALCRYFAVALAEHGITVNAVRPGWTEDSVLNLLPAEELDNLREWCHDWTPMKRLASHIDIANAVALLCTDEAGWITGQIISADGGASLMSSTAPLSFQLG